MFDITGKRFVFFLLSGAVILIGIVSLAVFGLKTGIEFSSGSLLTVNFDNPVTQADLKATLADLGHQNAIVQTTGGGDFIIRTRELPSEQKVQLETDLSAKLGPLTERSFEDVDPVIAKQTARTAGFGVALAALGVLIYVTWAFRRMPNPFRYGTCAIIALVHDAMIPLGIFSILGATLGWQVNLMFIVAILAVIGYSVNDTVVIFDRIRENLLRGVSASFETVVNNSLVETIARSINTAFTTLLVIIALQLFIGASIQNFAMVLLIGIIAGTYSSICIAPTLLIVWEKGEWGRFISWLPLRRTRA